MLYNNLTGYRHVVQRPLVGTVCCQHVLVVEFGTNGELLTITGSGFYPPPNPESKLGSSSPPSPSYFPSPPRGSTP